MAMKDIRSQAEKSASAKIGKMAGGDHKGAIRSKYGADPKGYLAGGLVRPQMPAPAAPAPMPGAMPGATARPMPAAPTPAPMSAPMPAPMPGAAPGGMGPMLARKSGGTVKAGAGSGVGRMQNNRK